MDADPWDLMERLNARQQDTLKKLVAKAQSSAAHGNRDAAVGFMLQATQ
jgi:predicted Zn-dependent protease